MWKAESMLKKLPQLNGLKNFVEETLIVSNIWKVLWNIFHNVESTIWIFYNANFSLHGKNDLKFLAKLQVKWFMLHNVRGEYGAVTALEWFATEPHTDI